MIKKHRAMIDCDSQSLLKQMFLFALPILFGTFFQQLYNTVDAIVIGNFAGKVSLAAVGGGTSSIINFLVTFFVGLTTGATVLVAQSFGANNREQIHNAVHTGLALAIGGGALLTVVGLFIAKTALGWMNTPDEVLPLAHTYMTIYFFGMIPNLVYNIGAGILHAVGDSKHPLIFLITACLVNIALDLLFVAVFQWGVFGVALATITAQLVSAILVVRELMTTDGIHKLDIKKIRVNKRMLLRIMRIGVPSGLQNSLYALSHLLIQSNVNAFGTDTMAAWSAFIKVDAIYWMIGGAFNSATLTFSGQFFGAGKYPMMKKTLRCGAMMLGISAAIVSPCLMLFGDHALRLFIDDAEVIAYGMTMIFCISSSYALTIPQELFSCSCRSAGQTFWPTVISGLCVCGFRMVWILFLLPKFPSRAMLYLCYPISWILCATVMTIYYFRSNWLKKQIALHDAENEVAA